MARKSKKPYDPLLDPDLSDLARSLLTPPPFESPYKDTKLPAYIYHNKTKSSQSIYPLIVLIQKIPNHKPASFYLQCECLDDALFYRNYVCDHVGRDRPDEETPTHYIPPSNPYDLLGDRLPREFRSPQCFIESTDDLHPPYYI